MSDDYQQEWERFRDQAERDEATVRQAREDAELDLRDRERWENE